MPSTLHSTVWSNVAGKTSAVNCTLSPNFIGANEGVIRSPAMVKGSVVVTEPVGVVIVTNPVVAAAGTVATIFEFVTLTIVADAPLKETVVTPPKPTPRKVTTSPGIPSCGEK